MTDKPNEQLSVKQASFNNGAILGIFALVSTGLIALTHLVTKDKIASELEAALARRLNSIIPAAQYDNDVYNDCLLLQDKESLGSDEQQRAYRMRKSGKNYAVFMTSMAPNGYSGSISFVIGIYEAGSIAAVRITEHQETPGLGDKIEIEKSDWVTQFDGLSLEQTDEDYWRVKKDGGEFDALTGATITPRAIVEAVNQTLKYYNANKQIIFNSPSNCGNDQ